MKRLTDERIAALIDMVPLNEAIVDIKSALIELQEYRKAAGEQAGLFIRVNNMFFQVATAGNDCDESVRDRAIPLYTEPQQEGWVKCSERLPPVEYEPDGGAVFYLAWHKNEVECGSQYSITNVVFLRRHWEKWYSHWMPLPPGPEAENTND